MADPAGASKASLDYPAVVAMVEALPPADGLGGVAQSLERLCRAAAAELGLVGASVRLLPSGASLAVTVSAQGTPERLGDVELETGEGPGTVANALARPILVPDLAGPEGDAWPGYRAAVAELGVAAVFVFPLHLGAAAFGTLELFAAKPGMLTREQSSLARTLAVLAIEVLLDGHLTQPDGGLSAGLARVFEHRAEIAQAQGMVMVDLGVSLPEAMVRLRAHAFARGVRLSQVAREVIEGYRLSSMDGQAEGER